MDLVGNVGADLDDELDLAEREQLEPACTRNQSNKDGGSGDASRDDAPAQRGPLTARSVLRWRFDALWHGVLPVLPQQIA